MKEIFKRIKFERKKDNDASSAHRAETVSREAETVRRGLYGRSRSSERPANSVPYDLPEGKELIHGQGGTKECLAASALMILHDHNHKELMLKDITSLSIYKPESGIKAKDAAIFLKDRGCNYLYYNSKGENQLRTALEKDSCILVYRSWHPGIDHAVVADHIDQEGIVSIRDPNKNIGALKYPYSEVEKRWTGSFIVPVEAKKALDAITNKEAVQRANEYSSK